MAGKSIPFEIQKSGPVLDAAKAVLDALKQRSDIPRGSYRIDGEYRKDGKRFISIFFEDEATAVIGVLVAA